MLTIIRAARLQLPHTLNIQHANGMHGANKRIYRQDPITYANPAIKSSIKIAASQFDAIQPKVSLNLALLNSHSFANIIELEYWQHILIPFDHDNVLVI